MKESTKPPNEKKMEQSKRGRTTVSSGEIFDPGPFNYAFNYGLFSLARLTLTYNYDRAFSALCR